MWSLEDLVRTNMSPQSPWQERYASKKSVRRFVTERLQFERALNEKGGRWA
jgi:hypothetical protein